MAEKMTPVVAKVSPQEKQRFFSDNPQDAFSRVDANITVEGEAVAAKAYDCWRLTPKTDDVPRIVFRDQEGNFWLGKYDMFNWFCRRFTIIIIGNNW